MGIARRESAGGILVVNLYALRTTDPRQLKVTSARMAGRTFYLAEIAKASRLTSSPVVCAWGRWGGDRGAFVAGHMLRQGAHLVCLGVTKGGHPKHPLYVRADQPLVPIHPALKQHEAPGPHHLAALGIPDHGWLQALRVPNLAGAPSPWGKRIAIHAGARPLFGRPKSRTGFSGYAVATPGQLL